MKKLILILVVGILLTSCTKNQRANSRQARQIYKIGVAEVGQFQVCYRGESPLS